MVDLNKQEQKEAIGKGLITMEDVEMAVAESDGIFCFQFRFCFIIVEWGFADSQRFLLTRNIFLEFPELLFC